MIRHNHSKQGGQETRIHPECENLPSCPAPEEEYGERKKNSSGNINKSTCLATLRNSLSVTFATGPSSRVAIPAVSNERRRGSISSAMSPDGNHRPKGIPEIKKMISFNQKCVSIWIIVSRSNNILGISSKSKIQNYL